MIKRVNETKRRVLKRVCLALVVLLLASAAMVGAGSADNTNLVSVTNQGELDAAIKNAVDFTPTTIELTAGTYVLYNNGDMKNKTIIFNGIVPGVIFDETGLHNEFCGYDIEFNNVKIAFPEADHKGFTHTTKIVYNYCTFNGTQTLYAPHVEFNSCTFEGNDGKDIYYVWTYGIANAIFNDCTFNTNGKAILCYHENKVVANVKLTNCKFYSDSTVANNKAAVETGYDYDNVPTYIITFENCTQTGFVENPKGLPTGSALFGNKNSIPPEYLKVTIKHKVTWQNYDGTVLDDELVLPKTTPVYNGATPTKPADDTHEYQFIGWNPTPAPIESATTYTAEFKAIELPSNDDDSSSQGSSVWLMGQTYSLYTSHVENGGSAYFSENSPIFKVTMPDTYTGDVTITTYSDAELPADKNVHLKVDVKVEPAIPFGETATIHFKLPLFLIQQNGFEASDVCLYHGNGGWTKLPTQYTIVGDIVYYESQTESFSPFAIVFEENAATPKDAPITPAPTTTEAKSPGFGVLAVLAGLGAVLALRKP